MTAAGAAGTASLRAAPETPARGSTVPVARARAVVTVAITLLIVLGEFAMLTVLYRLPLGTERQRVVAARFSGEVAAGPVTPTEISRFASDMRAAGAEPSLLAPVTAPGADLQRATVRLETQLEAQAAGTDRKVEIIYAGFLVFISLAWMVWFRKLVARHRAVERA